MGLAGDRIMNSPSQPVGISAVGGAIVRTSGGITKQPDSRNSGGDRGGQLGERATHDESALGVAKDDDP
jgi:hypothetical protein